MNTDSLIQPRIVLKFKSSSWSLRVKVFLTEDIAWSRGSFFKFIIHNTDKKEIIHSHVSSGGYNLK